MVLIISRSCLKALFMSLLLLNLVLFAGCTGKKKVTFIPKPQKIELSEQVRPGVEITARLREHYAKWSGTRYTAGGYSTQGIDCSGFVKLTYHELFDKELPRTAEEQAALGRMVSQKNLRPGDLVFFKTGLFQKHVGIYLGKSNFMHVSASRGLTVSKLENMYWSERYWKGTRLL
jgi:cell wall-associated NlpC family hydrolase